MEKNNLNTILEKLSDLKNIPNSKLVELMDGLTVDFESTKKEIIELTLKLDNIELLYNNILKEFEKRKK